MADYDYDVVVVGAGPGGYVAAIRAAQLGLKTACIEKRATLGGTCLNVGCIPSKALLHASHFYDEANTGHFSKFGITFKGVSLDLKTMLAEKDKAVKELTGGIEFLFKKNKVSWLKGFAAFKDAHTLDVQGADGSVLQSVTAKNVIIATGSDIAHLAGVVPDGKIIVTSDDAINLPAVPGHLVIIGGGYIGLELGSVWRRLGARVTVIEYAERITPAMDIELTREFQKILVRQGMDIQTSTKVVGVTTTATGATVAVEPAAGGARTEISADIVLLSIGRAAYTAGLNIEAAGLKTNARGQLEIQPDFSTAVPHIYAIGDCVPGPMLAHKAEDEGYAVAENIAGLNGQVNHDVIPAVVYTMPEVASVGKTEEELKASDIAYKVGKFPFMANSRAKTNRDTEGFVKVLADAHSGRVLGVHILGTLAGTMIAEAAIAMEFGATAEDIALTCHAHPTHAEAMKEAALAAFDRPIHI